MKLVAVLSLIKDAAIVFIILVSLIVVSTQADRPGQPLGAGIVPPATLASATHVRGASQLKHHPSTIVRFGPSVNGKLVSR